MSFREKTAWISLLTTLVVWGYYFTVLLRALSAGNADGGNLMGMFVGCVVLLIAMQIVFGVIAAGLAVVFGKREERHGARTAATMG